jgi:hypothetical protein
MARASLRESASPRPVPPYTFPPAPGESEADAMQLPVSFADRDHLPSDHYPVVCALDLEAPLNPR